MDSVPKDRARERQRAYEVLRGAFLVGRFTPGEVVTVRALTEAFGLSTLPVREATARLVGEGGLRREQNGRLRLPNLTLEEYRDLTEIRLALEPLAAADAAERHRADQSAALRHAFAMFAQASKNPRRVRLLAANSHLHFAVYRAANRPQLLQIIEGLWLRSGPLLTTVFSNEAAASREPKAILAVHERLVDRVLSRDPGGARNTMTSILTLTRDRLLLKHRFSG